MRSRGRFKTRRSRRDAEGPVSYRAVPLARFRREVVALLMAGRTGSARLDSTQALRLVIRWDKVVRLRHGQGKPPCNVADHILKYERDQAVCPCGNPLPSPLHGARDKDRGACRRCSRDPSRWNRLKGWRDRKMASRREDFEGMTHNVGEVTRAAARGQMPDFRKLRAVKNPISRLVERDPPRFRKTIYRDCPCGENAHEFSGKRSDRELEYKCRNCYRIIVSKPEWMKPLTREEWDRKEARKKVRRG